MCTVYVLGNRRLLLQLPSLCIKLSLDLALLVQLGRASLGGSLRPNARPWGAGVSPAEARTHGVCRASTLGERLLSACTS